MSGRTSTATAPSTAVGARSRIDPVVYRTAMGLLPTGVTVITAGCGQGTEAVTASSVTSVSLNPLLLLISVGADGRMRRRIDEHRAFTVNVLAAGQEALSSLFASRRRPSGAEAQLRLGGPVGRTGNVHVDGALLSVDCRLEHRYPGGDHVLFVGRVEALRAPVGQAAPLVYHRGGYTALAREVAA
ncbi:flavin reductase family protein [Streptomyces sp. NPDC000594]|uniref:flavin reductase family protein n=1 Tax=Streptomyces sp. NPDC000594 TaxID=3154261 RepID=UPI003316CEB0